MEYDIERVRKQDADQGSHAAEDEDKDTPNCIPELESNRGIQKLFDGQQRSDPELRGWHRRGPLPTPRSKLLGLTECGVE